MKCEYCGDKHNGSYGSGRFCKEQCARGFASKEKRQEINNKVSKKLKGQYMGLEHSYYKSHPEKIKDYKEPKPNFCPKCGNIMGKKSKLCDECNRKSDEYRKAVSKGTKGKTGGYREGGSCGKNRRYKGIWCDSSWELAWVIYNLEHGIKFEKNYKKFPYIYKDKMYNYIPDFVLDNEQYVEIKGYETEQFKAKMNQFPYKLIILYEQNMKIILDYVINKYGKNYIKMYQKIIN
jgi:hypothetical protein